MDLRGAVALVTGGNGGLGQRICHALAQEGAHVAVMYAAEPRPGGGRRPRPRLALSDQRRGLRLRHHRRRGRGGLVGEVLRRFGRLDILVNDAAYNKSIPFGDLDNLTLEVWDKIMAINLTGPMRLTKAVAPVMQKQGRGRIVNIASVAGVGADRLVDRLCRVRGRPHPPDEMHGRWPSRPRPWSAVARPPRGHPARPPTCAPSGSRTPPPPRS